MSVDCGRVDGLPVGLQIIGRPFDEETVLQVGHTFEKATGRISHEI
jgi:aspartyl-tRNA(Asn)/glutamyl-tRNA(Gln) amidotransferase subunit A